MILNAAGSCGGAKKIYRLINHLEEASDDIKDSIAAMQKNSTQKSRAEKLASVSENLRNLYHSICNFIESLLDDIASNQLRYIIDKSYCYPETVK